MNTFINSLVGANFRPAKNPKFSPGDIVSVTNTGKVYDSYRLMAYAQGILAAPPGSKKYEEWHSSTKVGVIGEVLSVLLHQNDEKNVYAIKPEKGKPFLIGEGGLKLKEERPFIPKELFEI